MVAVPEALRRPLDLLAQELARTYERPPTALEVVDVWDRQLTLVARVRLAGPGQDEHLYVKRFKCLPGGPPEQTIAQRIEREHDITNRLQNLLKGTPGLTPVRPVARYPDILTIVTAEAPGTPLLMRLERSARRASGADLSLEHVMANLARWIKLYQTVLPMGPALSPRDFISYVDLRLARLTASPMARFDSRMRTAVLEYLAVLAARMQQVDFLNVPVHADLALANVLVDDKAVTVIDYSMAKHGSKYLDLARLYTQLAQVALKPWHSRSLIERLQEVLLDEFERGLTPETPGLELQIATHRVNQFAKLASMPLRWFTNPWNARVALSHRSWLLSRIFAETGPGHAHGWRV